ncbi:diacylglycerol kinase family lipid kinase [[Clostridium] innocuum]|nr:diacylglycerol kinase family lipid kinase [[Clostridium] innocuum]
MNRTIRVIMNPKAGKQTAKTALFTICERFCAMQDSVQVHVTQYGGHAKELAATCEGCCDILVCIGGDGTWNEVISGVMETENKPVLAYLPSGTVNDFAATLKLPKSAHRMMDNIEQYRPFSCDIGKFNNRFFTYVAAFGIFTEISYSTPQSTKNSFGKIAYFLEGVKQLTNIPRYHVRAIVNKDEIIEDSCIFGCITNSKFVAGFTAVNSKDAQLDDGQFELLLIRVPNNPLDVQNIIAALLKHEVNETWMYFRKAADIRIESQEDISWTLDGEDGGTTSCVHIENKNRAVTILV